MEPTEEELEAEREVYWAEEEREAIRREESLSTILATITPDDLADVDFPEATEEEFEAEREVFWREEMKRSKFERESSVATDIVTTEDVEEEVREWRKARRLKAGKTRQVDPSAQQRELSTNLTQGEEEESNQTSLPRQDGSAGAADHTLASSAVGIRRSGPIQADLKVEKRKRDDEDEDDEKDEPKTACAVGNGEIAEGSSPRSKRLRRSRSTEGA